MRHITFGCIAALKSAEKESAENAHANICPIKETKITLHSDGRVDIDPPVPKCLASVENGLFRNLG
jgi:hypothetical protein